MTDPADVFHSDYKPTPYWIDETQTVYTHSTVPGKTDVLVVGSGYTGLHCALQTARAGYNTVVVEKYHSGYGCSTRNGGQVAAGLKPSFSTLEKRHGAQLAGELYAEADAALQWIEAFVTAENIDCDFSRCGCFHAAHSIKAFNSLRSELIREPNPHKAYLVPRAEQHTEIGSDFYHGGIVYPQEASIHPARYHQGLVQACHNAGVQFIEHTEAVHYETTDDGYRITLNNTTEEHTEAKIDSKQLVIATNGYTSTLTPWLQQRVIPIGSYIIATEPLPKTTIRSLFPTNRVVTDTCRVIYYYRASPDGTRVLFGGRVSASETNPDISGPKLHREMCRIFPQLTHTRISRSWNGFVAFSFDDLPHIGTHNGVHYAAAYCGSGIALSSYLGNCLGEKIVNGRNSAFEQTSFPTRPGYRGKPWFLPPIVAYYQWRDRMEFSA